MSKKVIANYDPATGLITDDAGLGVTMIGMAFKDFEEKKDNTDSIIKLKNAGFDAKDIIEIVKSGLLQLMAKYNSKGFSPKIEVTEITDRGLGRYWDVITRVVLEFKNPKTKGKNQITITEI